MLGGRARIAEKVAARKRMATERAGGEYLQASAAGPKAGFATGVSASTGQFIKEAAQARYAAGESEAGRAGRTGKKKKGGQVQKTVKRVVKQTGVKGKKLRVALRKPGLQPVEKKVIRKAKPGLAKTIKRTQTRRK